MGYVPPAAPGSSAPPLLNLDHHGMPRDYPTYMWLVYGRRVDDHSPARLAFLQRPSNGAVLPPADPDLMGSTLR